MVVTGPPDLASALVLLGLILAVVVRRTVALVRGTPYSTGWLFGFLAFYFLLYVAFAFATFYGALSLWGRYGLLLLVPYGAVVAAAAVVATPIVRRIVRFERREHGHWYYRLPWAVPVIFLGLFALRFGVEYALFGLAASESFLLPARLSEGALLVLVAVDLLFGATVGLLTARAVGVYRAFRDLLATPTLPLGPAVPSD